MGDSNAAYFKGSATEGFNHPIVAHFTSQDWQGLQKFQIFKGIWRAGMRIAFQGEPGAYSEAAVQEYFSSVANESLFEAVPCESFDAVFAAVHGGFCEYGLIPIENSLAGSIHRNYDLLLRHQLSNDAPIVIVGEYYLRVRHCLISLPGVRIEEIHKVISHPQALAQCEVYLRHLGVAVEAVYDTAGSVKILKEQGDRTLAAIASRRAADLYQMQILAEGIEDASA